MNLLCHIKAGPSRGPERAVEPHGPRHRTRARLSQTAAFNLIEVMIAMAIFFMAVFAILGMVSNTLRNARALQQSGVDVGMPAAELSLTNRLSEGSDSGDFGDLYPDYEWSRDVMLVGTNGLFRVDIVVRGGRGQRPTESRMSILLFRPDSPVGLPGFRR